MAESVNKPADGGSVAPPQGKILEMDITRQENAVGYREYLEAMDLEVLIERFAHSAANCIVLSSENF